MFVIVDPISSGPSLTAAFAERGWPCWHLYGPALRNAWAADSSARVLMHKTFEETLRVVGELAPRAVLAGSGLGVSLANAVAHALGLPHNEPGLALARCDKLHMARALRAAGVPAPLTEVVRGEAELSELLRRTESRPLALSARDGENAQELIGTSEFDLHRAFRELRTAHGAGSEVLVREYLDGPRLSVTTVGRAGEHVITGVYSKRVDEIDTRQVCRHSLLRREVDLEVATYVRWCLEALGVREGAAHVELRLTDRGPRLIGITPRLMGPTLPADVFVSAQGYSQATVLVERYLDPAAFAGRLRRPYAPARSLGQVPLRMHRGGIVRSMAGLDEVRRLPGFHSFARLPSLGSRVRERSGLGGLGGVAHFIHEDEPVLERSLRVLHDLEDEGRLFTITA